MSQAFFIIITAILAAYSLAPLLRQKENWLEAYEHGTARKALIAEKESYLRAIKDIEFEHASNKINDQDYAELRKHYGAKAAQAMQQIEQLEVADIVRQEEAVQPEESSQEEKIEIAAEITAVKEKLTLLESEWKEGEVNDDQYFIQYDEFTEELESLLKQLDNGQK